ncbi:MAG: DUF1697 domain-containing protein [Chitinivibrionales bacterium]|nr:DUF1697 domain-containing protein [Chitinivibrionales bacterium]
MKYIALLRGINVGGNRKVEMKRLRHLFESPGYANVATYLNSGNIIFDSNTKQTVLQNDIPKRLKKEFGFEIQTLVKNEKEVKKIADTIPKEWKNDAEQKTDVAYLFPEIDSKQTIDELPVKKEYIDMRYTKGAIIWNVKKIEYNKSHLNKIISLKQYQFMTVRNVNTARYFAGIK